MKERRLVVDYILLSRGLFMDKMIVEVSGEINLGSDHNLIWCEERRSRLEEGMSDPHWKWKADSRMKQEEYQQVMVEGFRGWEEYMEVYGWGS